MWADDCVEIGRGLCPCRRGSIIVQRCPSKTPFSKPDDTDLINLLDCSICKMDYGFFQKRPNTHAFLALRKDLQIMDDYEKEWLKVKEYIESSPTLIDIEFDIHRWLENEVSIGARFRLLQSAGLDTGLTFSEFRRNGFKLRYSLAQSAMALLGISDPELDDQIAMAEYLWQMSRQEPPRIPTGVTGLQV